MKRRQADELENQLERLAFQPIVNLSKNRLRQIFEAERLGKNSWRDIFDRLPEEVEVETLKIAEYSDEIVIMRADFFKDATEII